MSWIFKTSVDHDKGNRVRKITIRGYSDTTHFVSLSVRRGEALDAKVDVDAHTVVRLMLEHHFITQTLLH